MIRSCTPEDLDKITDIGNRAWRMIYNMFRNTYGDALFKLLFPDERARKGKEIRTHYERYPEWIFVCEEEGKIVGFITLHLDKLNNIGEICNNAVDPDCKLKGIGQQMYKAAFDYLRQQGMLYAKVLTGLDESHTRARKAYERAGFNIKWESVTYFKKI